MRFLRPSSGFTMIEILVVLVVVGLLASLAIVNLGGGQQLRELENEVREVYLLMQTANEQAILNNEELGLVLEDDGYQFVVYDVETAKWEVKEERLFSKRSYPEWLTVTLLLDDEESETGSEEGELSPDLMFLSSGETDQFEMEFTIGTDTAHLHTISSDGLNGIEWSAPGDEEQL